MTDFSVGDRVYLAGGETAETAEELIGIVAAVRGDDIYVVQVGQSPDRPLKVARKYVRHDRRRDRLRGANWG
jgi:hypothetical protein